MRAAILPALENEASEERAQYLLSPILFPIDRILIPVAAFALVRALRRTLFPIHTVSTLDPTLYSSPCVS